MNDYDDGGLGMTLKRPQGERGTFDSVPSLPAAQVNLWREVWIARGQEPAPLYVAGGVSVVCMRCGMLRPDNEARCEECQG